MLLSWQVFFDILTRSYNQPERMEIKKITIIDCFIRNATIENKLKILIDKLKSSGDDVLLISNTPADKSIVEMCDFYLYDQRNQLFQNEYTGVEDVDFWNSGDGFMVHNIKPGLQRHGLSVIINLFTSLDLAKSLGYTHFRRLECDDLFGQESMKRMLDMESECIDKGKKGIFYFNESPEELNVSFHYFFCEISYFLRRIERISSESDYVDYLKRYHGNLDFMIVESYVYENLKRYGCDHILKKDGKLEMPVDFSDTIWNTETSGSNMSEKYKGCITEIYNKYSSDNTFIGRLVYSNNYINDRKVRKIKVKTGENDFYWIDHILPSRNSWALHDIPENVLGIDVYEGGVFLYSQSSEKIKSYIKWD